jgi:hypothetical protein
MKALIALVALVGAARAERFHHEAGFGVEFPGAVRHMRTRDPAVVSVVGETGQGLAFLQARVGGGKSDDALKQLATETVTQLGASTTGSWRSVKAKGADAAFAIGVRQIVAGKTLDGEVRAARHGGDLVVWGALGPSGAFLDSFAFGERGVYYDEKNGFRVKVPNGWTTLQTHERDPSLLLVRGDNAGRTLQVLRAEVESKDSDVAAMAAKAGQMFADQPGYKQLALKHTNLDGRPVLEIWYATEDAGKRVVHATRWIVLPHHTLALALAWPGDAPTAEARATVDSFRPLR